MLLVLLLGIHNLHLLGDGIPRFPRLNRYKAGLGLSQELPPAEGASAERHRTRRSRAAW